MRLDKFLKVSRVIKRRTVANEACDAGRVEVNGKVANLFTILSHSFLGYIAKHLSSPLVIVAPSNSLLSLDGIISLFLLSIVWLNSPINIRPPLSSTSLHYLPLFYKIILIK